MTTATARRRKLNILRIVVLTIIGGFFVIPLWSMFKFSISYQPGAGEWDAWRALTRDPLLRSAIKTSLELAVLTAILMLILLLPTMVWVRLRVPWANRMVEFLCLLPLTIPAIVIVVGITNVMAWVSYLVTDGPLALTFPFVILVLPYCYRALDAGLSTIDVITLSEAARSLGASWFTVIVRIIVPNVRSAVLSAAFLAVAVVLGEYTFASLLHYETLQVVIGEYGLSNSRVSMSASLATLMFGFTLLLGLSFLGGRQRGRRTHE